MKAGISLFVILLFVMHTLVISAAEPSGDPRGALRQAGGNRSELETALRQMNGKDTHYLIAHASQYDLVNLTADQIVENITYARKVHVALPYLGGKLDEDFWREWVLPHRVLEEDVSPWRKELHEQLQPVVAGKKTVLEVLEAVRVWLYVGSEGEPAKITFGNSDDCYRTRGQMLMMGSGERREISIKPSQPPHNPNPRKSNLNLHSLFLRKLHTN